jgi:hypothetical protein
MLTTVRRVQNEAFHVGETEFERHQPPNNARLTLLAKLELSGKRGRKFWCVRCCQCQTCKSVYTQYTLELYVGKYLDQPPNYSLVVNSN